jgi:cardiolipin synthase
MSVHHKPTGAALVAMTLALSATVLVGCRSLNISLPVSSSGAAAPASASAAGDGSAAGLITAPDQGYQPIYDLIGSARTSIDMTMYELVDTTAENDLAAAAQRGVHVRVVLDQELEKSSNQAAFTFLGGHGAQVVWANPRYAATHQKTIVVDDRTAAIMTGNLTSRYYSTTRDFAVLDTAPADVAAIEQTFGADFAGTPITPANGADLVWSPTNAEPDILDTINAAHSSLLVENEEMDLPAVQDALEAAARRGVDVQVVMTRSSDTTKAFDELAEAGVHVATFTGETPLYIHAKVIVADGARALLGSENFSSASLTRNRELGLTITSPPQVAALHTTLAHDFSTATPWSTS